MEDEEKTKNQLIMELRRLHERIDELVKSETECKRIAEELHESEKKFRTIEEEKGKLLKAIEIAKEAVCITSQDGAVIYTNEAMDKQFGYKNGELIGKYLSILYAGPSSEAVMKKIMSEIENKGSWQGEIHNKRKDNTEFLSYATVSALEDIDGKILNYVSTQHDITKITEMQEQLALKEKLAVLGQLAGGVGHELRNPLGAIKNAVYFLNMALEETDPEVKETIELLRKEVAKSERIISSFLNFAQPKTQIRYKVNVNELVQEELSRNTMPENIKVVCRLDEKMPAILADPDQLVLVFGNIILNAIQAMPKSGELAIESKLESSKMAVVSFKDTGVGIPRKHFIKLFEPLFTTKARGIGFGLAIAKIIVEEHGGTIEVESEVGKGSAFIVRLPLALKS